MRAAPWHEHIPSVRSSRKLVAGFNCSQVREVDFIPGKQSPSFSRSCSWGRGQGDAQRAKAPACCAQSVPCSGPGCPCEGCPPLLPGHTHPSHCSRDTRGSIDGCLAGRTPWHHRCLSWATVFVAAWQPLLPGAGWAPRAARLLDGVLNGWPALLSPPADAALPQRGVFRPLPPGHAPADRLQKPDVQLPSGPPGARPDAAAPDWGPGSSPLALRHQGQPDRDGAAAGCQPGAHRGQLPAVSLLPALADSGAVGGLSPQCHAPGAPRPGGRPAGGGHRCPHQLAGRLRPGQPWPAGSPWRGRPCSQLVWAG